MNKQLNLDTVFKSFFEESLDALVLLDIEANKFILCNEKVYDIYGYTQKEFLEITPYDLSVEFKNNIQMESKQEEIVTKGYDKFITKHKTKDGIVLDIYIKSKRIYIKKRWYLFITLVDINKEIVLKQYFHPLNPAIKHLIEIKTHYKWDKFNKILLKDDAIISLTIKEKRLIDLFLKHKNITLNYEYIIENYDDKKLTKNSLLSLIKRIRKKTDNNFISTIYAKGYCIYC